MGINYRNRWLLTATLTGLLGTSACSQGPGVAPAATGNALAGDRHVLDVAPDASIDQIFAHLPARISAQDADKLLVRVDPAQVKTDGGYSIEQTNTDANNKRTGNRSGKPNTSSNTGSNRNNRSGGGGGTTQHGGGASPTPTRTAPSSGSRWQGSNQGNWRNAGNTGGNWENENNEGNEGGRRERDHNFSNYYNNFSYYGYGDYLFPYYYSAGYYYPYSYANYLNPYGYASSYFPYLYNQYSVLTPYSYAPYNYGNLINGYAPYGGYGGYGGYTYGGYNTPLQSATVNIANYAFQPSNLTIPVGGTVIWMNQDATTHSVTADSPSNAFIGAGDLQPGQTSQAITFSQPGIYPYHCRFHPEMHGSVTVQ